MSAVICLFAHQDDEYGLFQKIKSSIIMNKPVYCIYLTNGGALFKKRNEESLSVLTKLGVNKERILFIGTEHNIHDLSLKDNMFRAADLIKKQFGKINQIDSIYIPCWEGGHPDHDALHAIAVTIAEKQGYLRKVFQYPLYNNSGCIKPFFKVLSPLATNGDIFYQKISWPNRLLFLRLCLKYHSQKKTWLGLFPFVAFHYLFIGKESYQNVSIQRLIEKPISCTLYYEVRKFSSWTNVNSKVVDFVKGYH